MSKSSSESVLVWNRGSGSQSEKATELYRGTSQEGTYAVRYDARIESASWNDVVGELEDAEVQRMSVKLRKEIPPLWN